jgi:hypothetical protein
LLFGAARHVWLGDRQMFDWMEAARAGIIGAVIAGVIVLFRKVFR